MRTRYIQLGPIRRSRCRRLLDGSQRWYSANDARGCACDVDGCDSGLCAVSDAHVENKSLRRN